MDIKREWEFGKKIRYFIFSTIIANISLATKYFPRAVLINSQPIDYITLILFLARALLL